MLFLRPLFILVLLLNCPVFPQNTFSDARFDSFKTVIDTTELKNLNQVAKVLEKLQIPNDWRIAHLMGKLKIRQKDWSAAIKWFKKQAELNQQTLSAKYELAICYREQGVARDPISRRIIWNKSKNYFETVIAADSTFNQVFLEYAWLKRYQNKFSEAIDLCLTQLKVKSTPQARLDIFRFYDVFLVYGGAYSINPFKGGDDYVRNWLSRRNSPFDKFFLGEQARRTKNYATADSIYQFILNSELKIPQIPVYLARVRLLYETNQDNVAEATYWEALESVTSRNDFQPIYEDMLYIFSDEEFSIPLKTAADCKSFCRKFWMQKNPLPAAKHNLRLAEHYRRLVYAEKNFRYDGFRLFANDPDVIGVLEFPRVFYENRILNDKGLVYLRFGERDDWAVTLGAELTENESWLYHARGEYLKLIFHFEIDREGGGPGCWRLVPLPSNYKMFESRLGWDPAYYTLYSTRNELEFYQTLNRQRNKARQQVKTAMEQEFHTWPPRLETLPMNISVNRFRTPQQFKAEVAIALPRENLLQNQPVNFELESGAVVYDLNLNVLSKKLERLPIRLDSLPVFYADQLIRKFVFEFDTQKIQGASHVRQNENRLNAYKFQLDFTPLNTDSLTCSDIELAYQINPVTASSPFNKNGLEVIPNPGKTFDRTQPVFLYFEIYNLQKNESGKTYYEIEYTASIDSDQKNLVSKIWSKLSGKQAQVISITNKQEGTETNSVENIALDFSQIEGKKMKLKISVRDIISNLHCEAETEFELFN